MKITQKWVKYELWRKKYITVVDGPKDENSSDTDIFIVTIRIKF